MPEQKSGGLETALKLVIIALYRPHEKSVVQAAVVTLQQSSEAECPIDAWKRSTSYLYFSRSIFKKPIENVDIRPNDSCYHFRSYFL